MAIELNPIANPEKVGGFNSNFERIEEELNNNVLRRNGLSPGEANHLEVDIDMNGNSLLNVNTDLTDSGSLLSLGDADTRFVFVSGDTMTGNLSMGGFGVTNLRTPTISSEATRKDYVDSGLAGKVSKSGDSMSGTLDMSGNDVNNVGGLSADSFVLGGKTVVPSGLEEGSVLFVNTLADLQALPTGGLVDGQGLKITTTGRAGGFRWDSSNLASEVAADEVTNGEGDGGRYVAPASDKTGASGAHVRVFDGPIKASWYGLTGISSQDGTATINKLGALNLDLDVDVDVFIAGATRIDFSGNDRTVRFLNASKIVFDPLQAADVSGGMVKLSGSNCEYYSIEVDGGTPGTRYNAPSILIGGETVIARNVRVHNPKSVGSWGGGIMSRWCDDVIVYSASVEGSEADGCMAYSSVTGPTRNVKYVSPTVKNAGDDLFSVVDYIEATDDVENIQFIGALGEGGEAAGFVVAGGKNVYMQGMVSGLERGIRVEKDTGLTETKAPQHVTIDAIVENIDNEGVVVANSAYDISVKAKVRRTGQNVTISGRAINIGSPAVPPELINLDIEATGNPSGCFLGDCRKVFGRIVSDKSEDVGINILSDCQHGDLELTSYDSGYNAVTPVRGIYINGKNLRLGITSECIDAASNVSDSVRFDGSVDQVTVHSLSESHKDDTEPTTRVSIGSAAKVLLPKGSGLSDATDGDQTPNVKDAGTLVFNNSGATTIADFDQGLVGQEICVIDLAGNTTIGHNANIKNKSEVSDLMGNNEARTYVLGRFGVWHQAG